MDNGSRFMQFACRISIAYEQLLDFLVSSDAPDDLLKDMAWFKIKFDKYRKNFFDSYINSSNVRFSGSDSESELQKPS